MAFGLVLSLFSCQKTEVTKAPNAATKTTELNNDDIRAIFKEQGVKLKADAYAKAEGDPIKVSYGKWTGSAPYPINKIRCLNFNRICYFVADLSIIEDDGGTYEMRYEDDDFIVLVGDEANFGFYGKVIGSNTELGATDYLLRQ